MAKVFKLKSCSHSFSSNLTGFRIHDQIDQTQSTAERRPVAQNNSQTTKKHKLALLIFLVELGNNLMKKNRIWISNSVTGSLYESLENFQRVFNFLGIYELLSNWHFQFDRTSAKKRGLVY